MVFGYTIIILILTILIIGKIKFNEKAKKYIMQTISGLYNVILGYIDTNIALIMYSFFANIPKGNSYEVPNSEKGFNFVIGLVIFVIYLLIVIPVNFYARKKGKINPKIYSLVSILATIIGIVLFWIFKRK